MSETERLDVWAVVEVFGHQKIAGRVTEQALAGTTFLRVDVPETAGTQAYTRIFGAGAIYGITPCTEEQARVIIERGWGFSHPEFTAKQIPAISGASHYIEDAEFDELDSHDHEERTR